MKGGGGASQKKNKGGKKSGELTDYMGMPVVSNIDPFIANNQALLAQQLAAGFGGDTTPYMARMDQIYSPYQNVLLSEPLSQTKSALSGKNKANTGLLSLDRVLNGGSSKNNKLSGLLDKLNGFVDK